MELFISPRYQEVPITGHSKGLWREIYFHFPMIAQEGSLEKKRTGHPKGQAHSKDQKTETVYKISTQPLLGT